MDELVLHSFHQSHNGEFIDLNGAEAVAAYGDVNAEHSAFRTTAGIIDLSFRGRVCLTGADRVGFLHGQVTNDIRALRPGRGCYAALVNTKGKIESDFNIYCLAEELLLDFEPGLTPGIKERLEKYIVADAVEVTNVASLYGLLSVQGPAAPALLRGLAAFSQAPAAPSEIVSLTDTALGEIYVANQPRLGTEGFDLFIPAGALADAATQLLQVGTGGGARLCGWRALELARIEAGIPRFGADMDNSHFPQECGIEHRAMSYTKGCYLGQEVLNRIHTMGHVNRELRGLRLADDLPTLPVKGDQLFQDGKAAGVITSAAFSPTLHANIGLGYVRREAKQAGTRLTLRTSNGDYEARVVDLPFK